MTVSSLHGQRSQPTNERLVEVNQIGRQMKGTQFEMTEDLWEDVRPSSSILSSQKPKYSVVLELQQLHWVYTAVSLNVGESRRRHHC